VPHHWNELMAVAAEWRAVYQ